MNDILREADFASLFFDLVMTKCMILSKKHIQFFFEKYYVLILRYITIGMLQKLLHKLYTSTNSIDEHSMLHARRVRYLKIFYLAIIAMISVLIVIDSFNYRSVLLLIHLFRMTGVFVAYLLLKRNYYYGSIYTVFGVIFLSTIYGGLSMEQHNTFHLLFFPLCAAMFYLTKRIIINILFLMASTIALIVILYYQSTYQSPDFGVGTWYSVIIIMVVFFTIMSFFVYEYKYLEIELKAKNEKLKENNDELLANVDKLKESNEFITKLLSVIGHDLRNPFNNIIGFSTLLYKNIDVYDKEKQADFLQLIVSSSEKGYALLENLLSWARSQSHKFVLHVEEVCVNDVIAEVEHEYEIHLEQKNIRIKYNQVNKLFVTTDHVLLLAIIRNLLGNAIKFSPMGSSVDVSISHNQDTCNISISNEGELISDDIKAKIMDKNWQFTSVGTNGERGTGFGLTICLDFAERLNAKLDLCNSKEGRNCFNLKLPLNDIPKV